MSRSGLGAGYLPDDGGTLHQSALMLDAFAVMSAAEAELEKKHAKGSHPR